MIMSEQEESREKCKFQNVVTFLTLFAVGSWCQQVILIGANVQCNIQRYSRC